MDSEDVIVDDGATEPATESQDVSEPKPHSEQEPVVEPAAELDATLEPELDQDDEDDHVPFIGQIQGAERPPGGRYKSYRKKYRKMKLRFEDLLGDSNELFIQEHKLWDIARRIQEQNDQLLDILLDLNESTHIRTRRRYDLGSIASSSVKLTEGLKSLDELEKAVTHTDEALLSRSKLPADLAELQDGEEHHPGYLTSKHEDEYLNALDSSLASIPPTDNLPIDVETIQPTARPREKTQPSERDFAIKNPISVYHWMRKHQPQVFAFQDKVDKEKDSERPSPPPPGRRTKKDKFAIRREIERGHVDRFADPLDEEAGMEIEVSTPTGVASGGGRGRRNRDDEPYRPKGGKSRPSKRKRDSLKDDAEFHTKKARRGTIED